MHLGTALGALLLAAATSAAHDVVLVRDGRPAATVVVGDAPSEAARAAAQELVDVIARISGATLPIAASAPGGGTRVLVGQSAATEAARRAGLAIPSGLTPQFDDEGYVVCASDNMLILAGNETEPYEGTHYAVADLLESLGCRWYFPGAFGEVLPSLKTVRVPEQRRVVRPEFRVRDTWYSGHLASSADQQREFATWKRRNRMCRFGFWQSGTSADARFLQNPTDDSTYRLLPKDQYWDAHPEFYALNPDGTRNDRFLCMSNPAALDAAADTVVRQFTEHPEHHTFAFSPPDAPVLCHCPECTRAMNKGFGGEGYGDVSDAYFRFVFALADRVRERMPDRWITTMAYYNRCRPPQGVTAKHPNVLLQLASIQQCSLHSYAQEDCWSRRQFADMLRQWSELTAGQVFYEYAPHDWSHLQRPVWGSQRIADGFRLLNRLGGWGFSNEGQMAWMSTGLDYYVRAHLAWDLDQDPAELIDDFCRRFFGPAAQPMERYYMAVEEALRETPIHALGGPPEDLTAILTRPLLDRCAAWLAEATSLATREPYRARVRAFRVHFDRIDAYARAREAMAAGDYASAERWGNAMVDAVSRMGDTALLQDAGPWGGSLSGETVAKHARRIGAFTSGELGRLVAVTGARAELRTDPAQEGVIGQWYAPSASGAWRPIRTSTAWGNQGVVTPEGRVYSGVAWYRTTLATPAAASGPMRLLIPELKGSAVWVWCDGAYAGYAAPDEATPLTVPLPDLLPGDTHTLVLRVQGDGGLSLPPFVYVPTEG